MSFYVYINYIKYARRKHGESTLWVWCYLVIVSVGLPLNGCHHVMVDRLACSHEPHSFVNGSLVLLVRSTVVNGNVVGIQSKLGPTVCQLEQNGCELRASPRWCQFIYFQPAWLFRPCNPPSWYFLHIHLEQRHSL